MPQKKSKKILIYFFLFLMVGTLNNKNFSNINIPKINKISVVGLNEDNNFQLMNSLIFLEKNNLVLINKNTIKAIINKNNLVETYSVFKKYPSTLNIKIYKTNFLAKVKKNNYDFLLGSNGKLTQTTNSKQNLPSIIGDFNIKNFFQLKNMIDDSNLDYNNIKNLFFFKSGRWDIEMRSGILIKLPSDRLKKSLELLLEFLNNNKEEKIYKIDLRQQNQIIING